MSWFNSLKQVAKYSPTVWAADWAKDKAQDPNYNLLPGISINNRPGERDINPWNNPQQPSGGASQPAPQPGGSDQGPVDNGGGGAYNAYSAYSRTGSSGSRAAAAPAYNPDDLNYLNDQEGRLRAMFGEADTALNQGRQGIADEFGRTEQRKREDQARVNRDYDNKEADTTTKKQSALGKVNDNARTLANSVRRKLALASGTSSSAYQDEAPQAVAKEATEGRTNVLEDFAGNFNALKRAREDTKSEFERMFEDLRIQRQGRERQLEEGVMANRQDIDTKLSNLASERAKLLGGGYKDVRIAQQPYEAAINARKAEISSLFDKYRTPFTPQAVNIANPSLRDYLVERKGITPEQQQVETYNDYLTKLKKQDEEGAF